MKTIITIVDVTEQNEVAIDTTLEFIADEGEELKDDTIMTQGAMIGGFIVHLIETGEIVELADKYYREKLDTASGGNNAS